MPIDPRHVIAQARTVLADIPVAAVKIGLLGSVGIVDALQEILTDCDGVPVVLDPIHRAGGGAPLASDELTSAVLSQLVPRITVLTPNTREAHRLAPGAATLTNAAQRLLSSGCGYVLVTGADEATPRRRQPLLWTPGTRRILRMASHRGRIPRKWMHAGRRGGRGAGPRRRPAGGGDRGAAIHPRRHFERIPDRGRPARAGSAAAGRAGMVSPPVERGADDTNPLPRALCDHVRRGHRSRPSRQPGRRRDRRRSRHDPVSRERSGRWRAAHRRVAAPRHLPIAASPVDRERRSRPRGRNRR